MQIRIYSYLYRPDHAGGASVFTDMAEGLARRGHDVSVVCAHPFYPEWTNKSGANPWLRQAERVNGVEIVRHGMFIPRDPSSVVQRALYEGSFFLSQLRSLFRGPKGDVIIALAPLVSSVALGVLTALVHRRPLWIHVQDVSSGGVASFDQAGTAQRILGRIESALFKRADHLSTISPVMADGLALMTGRNNIEVLPNWLHSELGQTIDHLKAIDPSPHGSVPSLLYAGNIGVKQGLDQLVLELHELDLDFRLMIYGTGSGAPALDAVLARLDDDRFRRGPFLAEEDFAKALIAADLFVVSELDTGEAAFLPSKLVPAAACGCPVLAICGDDSPIRTELDRHGTGRWLRWTSLPDIGSTIESMLTTQSLAEFEMNTSKRSDSLGSEAALDRIEDVLARIDIRELGSKADSSAAA